MRGGTENVPGIVGFGKAAEVWARIGDAERARLRLLRDALEKALRSRIPDLVVNASGADRVPNTLNATFPGCKADLMVMGLDMRGVRRFGRIRLRLGLGEIFPRAVGDGEGEGGRGFVVAFLPGPGKYRGGNRTFGRTGRGGRGVGPGHVRSGICRSALQGKRHPIAIFPRVPPE